MYACVTRARSMNILGLEEDLQLTVEDTPMWIDITQHILFDSNLTNICFPQD